jgi:hypothetical protein
MLEKVIGTLVEPSVPRKDKSARTEARIPSNKIGSPPIDLIFGDHFLDIVETWDRFVGAAAASFFITAIRFLVIKGEEVTAAEMSRDYDPIVILTELNPECGRFLISA